MVLASYWLWFELGLVGVGGIFLLFPTVAPSLTLLVLLALPAVWLAQWLAARRPFPITPFNLPLLIWGVAIVGSIWVSADPDLTLPKATGLILGLAVWRLMVVWLDRPGRIKIALTFFAIAGGTALLVGLFSADWHFEVAFVQKLLRVLPPRLITLPEASEGVHTNELAAIILFYSPLAVALWWWGRQRWSLGLALLFLGWLLLLTQSRSGWLGALAGLAALPLLAWRGKLRPGHWLMVFGLIALLCLVGLAGWAAVGQKLPQETVIGTLETVPFRFEVWRWGLAVLHDFPLIGPGLGTFRRVVFRFYPIDVPAYFDIAHAHNIFLQVALDTGLLGLVAYWWLLARLWHTGRNLSQRVDWLRPVTIGLLAGLIALHVYGFTDALAPGSKPHLFFWLILGLLTACGQFVDRTDE